jgi:fermentation-respiration switch protein FrsA (DUF1100 family)
MVFYGESLGTAVAAALAAEQEPAGVILESGFTSARAVARELYRFLPLDWVIASRFDTLGNISRVRAPLLILHSAEDEFFGLHHAEALLAAAAGPKRLVQLRGGHNDAFLVSKNRYTEAIASFLQEVASGR